MASASSESSRSSASGGVSGSGASSVLTRKPSGHAPDYTSVSSTPYTKRRESGSVVLDRLGARRDGRVGEKREEKGEKEEEEYVALGPARLVHLPDLFAREGGRSSGGDSITLGVAGETFGTGLNSPLTPVKSVFPTSASVSLPTSSSALDYLLYHHNSISCSSGTNSPHKYEKRNLLDDSNALKSAPSIAATCGGSVVTLPPSEKSSSDYLNLYRASLGLNSREDVSGLDRALPSDTMMIGLNRSSVGSNQQLEGWDMKRKSASLRGKPGSRAISEQFFQVEPCLFTHRMFVRAAKIFEVLKSDDTETMEAKAYRRRRGEPEVKQKIPDMDFRNAQEQIKTFELTFATLKYQDIFRDILEKTGFFHEFSNLRNDFSLVCIILFDLQSRKFQKRIPLPEEYEIEEADTTATPVYAISREDGTQVDNLRRKPSHLDEACIEVENALLSRKTRLQSCFAKERIKKNASSIEHLLPEQVRHKDETKSLNPVFCWVNQMKTSMESIMESLRDEGFEEMEDGLEISEQNTKVFRRDPHCSDLLVFPPNYSMYFKESDWVRSGQLVPQDKSSCLAPQTVHLLLGIDQDVIHVNVGTGMTTAHIASLLRHRSPHSHIWAFESGDVERSKKAARNLEFLGAKNTKIIPDHFLNSDPEDSKFRSVRVIMITANCSKSAITSPVQFIVSEGEDMQILGELSQADSNLSRIKQLTFEHETLLKHALKFPRIRAVVYTTRSRYQAENEQVVNQVLEAVNGPQNGKRAPFKVSPPVLPFSGDEIGTEMGLVDGKFARFRPSDRSNGCFVAIISREPEDPKEAAKSAIARARSKGVLDKRESAVQQAPEGAESASAASPPLGKSRSKTKRPNGPETRSSGSALKQKLSHHKTPASVGARLYQAGLISRMEQVKLRPHKPEHIKVIKHPAPFSNPPEALALRL